MVTRQQSVMEEVEEKEIHLLSNPIVEKASSGYKLQLGSSNTSGLQSPTWELFKDKNNLTKDDLALGVCL